ncbi:Basic-leucine zipper domain [Ceraceosorus bombacis]|uniref:Basic-leucine zipper domain n=1 Tax=Ceraceosorus bombacis TaxID=401625 RepID=A0A0P1BRG1_9BASI|nr:Basic-leucine zipper domain [Ceraceosorus bombacis]
MRASIVGEIPLGALYSELHTDPPPWFSPLNQPAHPADHNNPPDYLYPSSPVNSTELTSHASSNPHHSATLTPYPGRPQPSPSWPQSINAPLNSSSTTHLNKHSSNASPLVVAPSPSPTPSTLDVIQQLLNNHQNCDFSKSSASLVGHQQGSTSGPTSQFPPHASHQHQQQANLQPLPAYLNRPYARSQTNSFKLPQHRQRSLQVPQQTSHQPRSAPPTSDSARFPQNVQNLDQAQYQRLLFRAFASVPSTSVSQSHVPASSPYFLAPLPPHLARAIHTMTTSSPAQATSSPVIADIPDPATKSFEDESFSLGPMSADDPAWLGHGLGRPEDDFFSSPEWTDPSPALTCSLSFDAHSSYDPSPLLADNYEGELPELAGFPLFGPAPPDASSSTDGSAQVSPVQALQREFAAHMSADADFTLFPESEASATSPSRRSQMAFSRETEDPALKLLRALSSSALPTVSPEASAAAAPTACASPQEISLDRSRSTPTPEVSFNQLASSSSTSGREGSASERRGVKRRSQAELLPMDAPIQPRKYSAPSATSRRDAFLEEEAAIAAETDAVKAKRMSNTLSARRSRLRKQQEQQAFTDRITELEEEVAMWKRRCLAAEAGRLSDADAEGSDDA